jgi:hypothetical protein
MARLLWLKFSGQVSEVEKETSLTFVGRGQHPPTKDDDAEKRGEIALRYSPSNIDNNALLNNRGERIILHWDDGNDSAHCITENVTLVGNVASRKNVAFR